ncbi:MAG: aminotransferase class V-fold PLP-dependent enzyme [Desulfobacter sp.]
MIPDQRHMFSMPDDVAYLNCAYTAPLLKAAEAAGKKAVAAKTMPWQITPADFFSFIRPVREKFAGIVQCRPGDVAIIPSVSYGIAVAARNLPLEKGQEVLVLEDQFPSNVYAWQRKAAETGAVVKTVNRPPDHDWTTAVLEAFTKKTAIAALPNCHWTDGGLLDLVRIGRHCRENHASLCIDATQSLGAMPFSVEEIQPDFVVTTAHKWLLGPYSCGFLYAAPRWQSGTPLEENWMNRKGSEDFSRLVDYQEDYQAGAIRFDMGEVSNFFLSPVVNATLGQILDWGVANIAQTLAGKINAVVDRASSLGLLTVPEKMRSPHMTGIGFSKGLPKGLVETLGAEKIFVSIRGESIRVSPHLYTRDRDIDRLFDALSRHCG